MRDSVSFLHRVSAWTEKAGMTDDESTLIKMAITITVAILIYIISRKWLSKLLKKVVGKTKSTWDDILYDQGFFRKLASLIPPFTAYIVLTFITWEYKYVLRRLVDIWLIIVTLFIITSLLNAINKIYESYPVSKNRPITFFIQLIKVFLYTVVVITVVSVLVNKSPEHLIVGLSAFAAVLLLIFKDSILGFVAGIQLTSNNMIRIGDWIQMDKNNANGVVLEVNLYTVKVQNWDMTISMVPTYQLVSESFTNWRGMQESGGRRVKRSINIDMTSVHFCTPEMLAKYRKIQLLKDYVDETEKVVEEYNKEHHIDNSVLVNGRRQTNLGVFRAYLTNYLKNLPTVNQDLTCMVRQLQPTETGIPLELYFFSANKVWVAYEGIQADVFDHVLAIIPEFDLRVFQNPSGADLHRIGVKIEN